MVDFRHSNSRTRRPFAVRLIAGCHPLLEFFQPAGFCEGQQWRGLRKIDPKSGFDPRQPHQFLKPSPHAAFGIWDSLRVVATLPGNESIHRQPETLVTPAGELLYTYLQMPGL